MKVHLKIMSGNVSLRSKLCLKPADMMNLMKQCTLTDAEINDTESHDINPKRGGLSKELTPEHNLCFQNQLLESLSGNIRKTNEADCIYVFGIVA